MGCARKILQALHEMAHVLGVIHRGPDMIRISKLPYSVHDAQYVLCVLHEVCVPYSAHHALGGW